MFLYQFLFLWWLVASMFVCVSFWDSPLCVADFIWVLRQGAGHQGTDKKYFDTSRGGGLKLKWYICKGLSSAPPPTSHLLLFPLPWSSYYQTVYLFHLHLLFHTHYATTTSLYHPTDIFTFNVPTPIFPHVYIINSVSPAHPPPPLPQALPIPCRDITTILPYNYVLYPHPPPPPRSTFPSLPPFVLLQEKHTWASYTFFTLSGRWGFPPVVDVTIEFVGFFVVVFAHKFSMGETTDQAAHRAHFKCGISNLNLICLDKNNFKN